MLATGPAEAIERVARDVIPALHGNLLDRVRHVFDRDLDESISDLLALRPPICCARSTNALRTAFASRGRFCAGPKIFGKKSGMSFPTITLASVTANGPSRL